MPDDDYCERIHLSLFESDLALLRKAYPPGQLAGAIRTIVHNYCEENYVRLSLANQSQPTR